MGDTTDNDKEWAETGGKGEKSASPMQLEPTIDAPVDPTLPAPVQAVLALKETTETPISKETASVESRKRPAPSATPPQKEADPTPPPPEVIPAAATALASIAKVLSPEVKASVAVEAVFAVETPQPPVLAPPTASKPTFTATAQPPATAPPSPPRPPGTSAFQSLEESIQNGSKEENSKDQWVSMSRLERKRFQEKRRRLEFKEALDKLLETLLRHDEGFLKEAQIREARFSGRVINRPPNTDENSLFNRVEMVNQAIFTIERSARENEEMTQSIATLREGSESDSRQSNNPSRLRNAAFHQGGGHGMAENTSLHQHQLHHGASSIDGMALDQSLLASGGPIPKHQPAYTRSITANAGASTRLPASTAGGGNGSVFGPDMDHLGNTSGLSNIPGLGSQHGGAASGAPGPQDLMWLRQLELEGRRQQMLSQQSIAQLQMLNSASARMRGAMPGTTGVNLSMGGAGMNGASMGGAGMNGGMGGAGMNGGMGAGIAGMAGLLPFLQLGGSGQHSTQLTAHLSALEQQQHLSLAAQQQLAGLGRGFNRPDEIPSELLAGGTSSDIYVPAAGCSSSGSRKQQRLNEGGLRGGGAQEHEEKFSS